MRVHLYTLFRGFFFFFFVTFAFHVNLAAFLHRVRRRYQVPRGLRYVDLHRLARRLHPGRGVHGIAKQTVPGHLQTDDSGDRRAGVHAHADLQMRPCDGKS